MSFGSSNAAKFMTSAVLGLLALSSSAQSTYPSRTISLVVQTPPGGPLDGAMRIVAKHLAQRLGNGATVVVDNRPGAGGLMATEQVARMLLAEKGLPSSANAGYELFDKMGSMGLTSFMQEVTRVRALEGELSCLGLRHRCPGPGSGPASGRGPAAAAGHG